MTEVNAHILHCFRIFSQPGSPVNLLGAPLHALFGKVLFLSVLICCDMVPKHKNITRARVQ